MSIWLVGSSSIRKLHLSWVKQNSFSLTFSPPDKNLIFLYTFSPVKRNLKRAALKFSIVPTKYFLASSIILKLSSSNSISWGIYPITILVPSFILSLPFNISLIKVDFPVPLSPTRHAFSLYQKTNLNYLYLKPLYLF